LSGGYDLVDKGVPRTRPLTPPPKKTPHYAQILLHQNLRHIHNPPFTPPPLPAVIHLAPTPPAIPRPPPKNAPGRCHLSRTHPPPPSLPLPYVPHPDGPPDRHNSSTYKHLAEARNACQAAGAATPCPTPHSRTESVQHPGLPPSTY